ncbi:MAG TPA: hypothetical protein VFV61_03455, partial [Pyrinomonadaceae bacterium]|nr:hypothetical protein [Pyrinomonadaceae bacterium]
LQEVAGNLQSATASSLGGLAKVYSATKSLAQGTELAQSPQVTLSEPPRMDVIAAGGSVTLASFASGSAAGFSSNKSLAIEKVHSKLACSLRKRDLPKAADKDLNWEVVAQAPKRMELLRHEFPIKHNAEIAQLLRREPKLRAIISKLPIKAGKGDWSNVGEFRSLSDVIGFGLKAAQAEEAEIQKVETTEDATRHVFEFKRAVSDSEKDEMTSQE